MLSLQLLPHKVRNIHKVVIIIITMIIIIVAITTTTTTSIIIIIIMIIMIIIINYIYARTTKTKQKYKKCTFY